MHTSTINKSLGTTETEQLLARLADQTFLNLWSFPNPFKDDGDELCDLLVIFENTIIIFFDRESNILKTGNADPSVLWKRWKRKVIDDQIRTVRGAQKYLRSGRKVFLDAQRTVRFPIQYSPDSARILKFIVAHGAMEACRLASEDNVSGSLAIAYSDTALSVDHEFFVDLRKEDPVHILDSENIEVVFRELDTISDFVEFYAEKERAINTLDFIHYCAEEDLIAYYFRNFDKKRNRNYIKIPKRQTANLKTGLSLGQGFWLSYEQNPSYRRKKEADRISYFWDKLITKTAHNILSGQARGNSQAFEGKSAIHEMAKESRLSRRNLSKRFLDAVESFPAPNGDSLMRKITYAEAFDSNKAYILLQLHVENNLRGDHEKDYAPKRQAILEIACAAAKNKFSHLKSVVGIAVDPPKYATYFSEDLMLMKFDDWNEAISDYYRGKNRDWKFFETGNWETGTETVEHFPRKPTRNQPCFCGSGKKFKKCHGAPVASSAG